MIQCECAVDEVMRDCPIHGVNSVVPPDERGWPVPPPQDLVDRLDAAERRLAAARAKRVEGVRFAGQQLRPGEIVMQPLGPVGELMCLVCPNPIGRAEFFVEVRQRDDVDTDPRLAVHARCLGLLP